ncbi:sulfurtransferase [Micromonospora sp. NPDC003197]
MSESDDLLVSPSALAAELVTADPPTILDVRWRLGGPSQRDEYAVGHLPGAVFVELDELCGPAGVDGRHPLPDSATLRDVLRAAGVRAGHPVVVYDGGEGLPAARLWWTLRWAGHQQARILDGGYPAWQAAELLVSTDLPEPEPGDIEIRPGALPVLDARTAADLAVDADAVLIDVRAPERFRGETEPIDPVAGHIPGAVNLPVNELTGPDGRWPDVAELRSRFARVGVAPEVRVGAYCGSGVTAAHTVFALHLAGRPDAALYVGSWSDWVTDPSRPVATGPADESPAT